MFKKKLVFHLYTNNANAYAYAKPDKAIKFLPKFLKSIDGKKPDEDLVSPMTMKHCVGLLDAYKTGFMLPLWSDLNIEIEQEGSLGYRWQYADGRSNAVEHSANQRGSFAPQEKYQHLKLESPWVAIASKPVNCFWADPTYNNNHIGDITAVTGVLSMSAVTPLNANLLFLKGSEKRIYELQKGQPLAHIIPITEEPYEIEYHLVSNEEYDRIQASAPIVGTFSAKNASYRNNKNACPYSKLKGLIK